MKKYPFNIGPFLSTNIMRMLIIFYENIELNRTFVGLKKLRTEWHSNIG